MKIRNLTTLFSSLFFVYVIALVMAWYGSHALKDRLIEQEAISEAVRWAEFVAAQNPQITKELSQGQISRQVRNTLELASQAGGIYRYKIFGPFGIILHASQAEDVGRMNTEPYFEELVSSGKTFAKIEINHNSGKDRTVVSEAYAPIIENGRFKGAVDVYVDETKKAAKLDRITHIIFWSIAALVLVIAAVWASFVWRALADRDRALAELNQQEAELKEQNARFNTALENMSQGLCLFDAEHRLIVANERYATLYDLSLEQMKPGTPLREILEYRTARGHYAGESPEAYIQEQIDWVSNTHVCENRIVELNDGQSIAVFFQPMDGGGWVSTHENVTESKRISDMLRAMVESFPGGISIIDSDLKLTMANDRFYQLLDLPKDTLPVGCNYDEIIRFNAERGDYGEGDPEAMVRERVELSMKFEVHSFERRRPDGTVLEIKGYPLPQGGFATTYVDITERKKAEVLNLRLARIVEDSINEVFVFDSETLLFEQVNAVACRNLGYTMEELAGMTPIDLKPESTPERFEAAIASLRCGEKDHIRFQTLHRRRDGSHYDADIVLQQIQSGDQPVFAAIIEDVTDRKKAEKLLEEQASSMALLNEITVAANQSESIKDILGHCVELVCKFTGWEVGHAHVPAEEGSGRMKPARCWYMADSKLYEPFREITDRSFPVLGAGLVGHVFRQESPYWIADVAADPDFARAGAAKSSGLKGGMFFPVKVRGEVAAVLEFFATEPMESSPQLSNTLTQVAAQIGQVVERERSTKKLTDQNERFNTALDNMSQGLCMFDKEKRLIVANERYASIYNLSFDLLKPGTTLRQILEYRIANGYYAGANSEAYIRERMEWVESGERSNKIQELNDGQSIAITHRPMPGGGWVTTHEDVTEITRTQKAVKRQKEELYQILRNVPRAIITSDSSGIIKTFNPAAEQTFGYTAAEAIGRNVSLLMPEQDRHHHDGYITSYMNTGRSKFIEVGPRRLSGCRKGGAIFPMELALGMVGQGEDRGFIAVAQDITEELKAENRLLEHRDLLQKEVDLATEELKSKAEELEQSLAKEKELNELQRQFVSMASHEFRTPLAIIDGSVQRLIRHKGDITPDGLEARAKKIRSAVKTMTMLMDSTLSDARMDAGKLEIRVSECDLVSVVLDACVRQLEINEDHKIVCNLAELPKFINGDGTALDQIFSNLLTNAVKYSPKGPDIIVKGWREGDDALISITDRGIGIGEEDLPNMFGRFFRATTAIGIPGTGIGLALVKNLAELHGGSVWVDSKKGEGSTFTVRLPIGGPDQSGLKDKDTDSDTDTRAA